MNPISEAFGSVTIDTLLLYGAAITAIGVILYKAYKVIVTTHDYVQNEKEDFKKLQDEVKNMKTSQATLENNIKASQIALENNINAILENLKSIESKMDKVEEESREREQNRLRNSLLQSYRYYTDTVKNPMLAWTEMEADAFNKLLHDYYALNGNGHVKHTVEPAMNDLKVISMTDSDGITELMKSRRG